MAASSSTAASTSTSAAVNPNTSSYQVFINHRGVDVKKTFARSLYLRLLDKGLTAFLDEEEMKGGYEISSQLEYAISTASVHVTIFSLHYAESDWCLKELLLMLKSKAPILPVFYGVNAAYVRWMKGLYGEALESRENKGRYDPNTIEEWRNALHQVAGISGFELETCSNGEPLVLELLDKVVKRLTEMVPKSGLYVAEYPTGLDYKLKDFEDTVLLQQQLTGKPPIFGIVGLGGVGKTTLAKVFFNKKKSDYDRSCFLSDIRDHQNNRSLNLLQCQLLNSLTGLNKQVNSVDECKEMLIEPLKSFKAVIVLDDVDNVNQVKALLPVHTHDLNSQSLILITSRDRDVLRTLRVEKPAIYTLYGLDEQHSRELFCSHAFSQADPLPGFESLVYKFLKCCNGLPLSLKVVGALLYNKEITDWVDELECLKEILPSEIRKTLYISYQSLNQEEKDIFLDIACFLINQNRDAAIRIWNKSGWRGKRGFINLQDKSLVEVDELNYIHMHDHLRDLGRHVAASSSALRLWRTKNVTDYLSHQSSGISVRGIRMVHGDHVKDDAFGFIDAENAVLESIFRGLQILHIEGSLLECILSPSKLERIFSRLQLPKLIWLHWERCPHSSLPSWVPIKSLMFLTVSHSNLNILWQTEGESLSPLQVPVYLEELRAGYCMNLKCIPGLAQATKLRILYVSGCFQLEELPSMEKLVFLEELWACNCPNLKSIRGLAHATKLRILYVSGCFEELPSMEKLIFLEELWAVNCSNLKSIRGLAQATKLRSLDVSWCSELDELPSMQNLVFLEDMRASHCRKLKSIRGLEQATKLRSLCVSGCSELEELPSMENSVFLEDLQACNCRKLKSIRGLAKATKLRSLRVSGCSELEELPNMEKLVFLEELWACNCPNLKSIGGLAHATKLRFLHVSGCSELKELPSIDTLVSLEELGVRRCKLKSIRGLAQATKLRSLDVSYCSELDELPSMQNLVFLEDMRASHCSKLKSIRGLEQATKLRSLRVSGCSELEELPSMEKLVFLEDLQACNCRKLKSIRGLAQATKLRLLRLSECSKLQELPSIETLESLEELWVNRCVKLKSIPGLARATKITSLDISRCYELEELPSMETLVSLKELKVGRWEKIRGLAHATQLRSLEVWSSDLEELPSMETMVSLENLWVHYLNNLKRIQGLAQATKLRFLHFCACYELEELPIMDTLVSLEELDVCGCPKLKRIQGLAQAAKLRVLRAKHCFELEEASGAAG